MTSDPSGPLVLLRTDAAAELVNVAPDGFRTWARRRGLAPVGVVRVGRTRIAMWDADAVLEATTRSPRPWREGATTP